MKGIGCSSAIDWNEIQLHNRLVKLMKLQEAEVSDMMDTDIGILAHTQSARFQILKWTERMLGLEWAVCAEYTLSNGWHYRHNRDDGLRVSSLREQVSAKPWY